MARFQFLLLATLPVLLVRPMAGQPLDNPSDNSATETTRGVASANLSISMSATSNPVTPGQFMSYHVLVTNAGPSNAANVTWTDVLPPGTTFGNVFGGAGWTCTTPAVGAGGTVSCSIASFAPGGPSGAFFTLIVQVDATVPHGSTISNTATVTSTTPDPSPGDENSTSTIGVRSLETAISLTKTDTPDPVAPGGNITYTITVTNHSVTTIEEVGFSDLVPAGMTVISLAAPAGWTCSPSVVGSHASAGCGMSAMPPGSAVFTLVLQVSPSTPLGTTITTSTHLGATDGPDVIIYLASTSTQVLSPAAVSATKTVSGSFTPGSTVTYTVVLSNAGPSTQRNNLGRELIDVLPAGLTLVSATATSSVATVTLGTNTVTWDGLIPANSSVTITITATVSSAAAPGTTISNQGSLSYDADGNGTNESSGATDNPATAGPDATSFVVVAGGPPPPVGPANIPTLDEIGLALLVLLLAMGGALTLRRRSG